jgi:[ribosomal protein S5]-alanine N-acetyltransferase
MDRSMKEVPTGAVALETPRLRLTPVQTADLDELHVLVTDSHVRRYLCDGQVFPLEWTAEQIEGSSARFADTGLGLWLARLSPQSGREPDRPIGFCGFLGLSGTGLALDLVYALVEAHARRGLATEMAARLVARARELGCDRIEASVDAVNAGSVRILERLGFAHVETTQGAFGDLRSYRLDLVDRAASPQ